VRDAEAERHRDRRVRLAPRDDAANVSASAARSPVVPVTETV
jgi:hypothetical protein